MNSVSISVIAVCISCLALVVPYLSYKRETRKSNQDLVFAEKITAYKEITIASHRVHLELFDLVNKIQFNNKDNPNWQQEFSQMSNSWYAKGFDFKELIYKYVSILPRDIFKKSENLSMSFVGFVTMAFHNDNDMTINGYEENEKKLYELIDAIREDLKIDKIDFELSNRLK
jgi:hypothetical protein